MMNVIKIAQYSNNKGLTAKQAIDTANQEKIALLTNKDISNANQKKISFITSKDFDNRLLQTDTCRSENEIYPVWTGTLVAYSKAGEKTGKFIEYIDSETGIKYVFEAGDAKGEKNVILAINHGFTQDGKPLITYTQDGEKTILVQIDKGAKADVIPNFPTGNGAYLAESKFGIPVGDTVIPSQKSHFLRISDDGYVGLLVREGKYNHPGHLVTVEADVRPSIRFGVLGIDTRTPAEVLVAVKKIVGEMQSNVGNYKKLGELSKQLEFVLQNQ